MPFIILLALLCPIGWMEVRLPTQPRHALAFALSISSHLSIFTLFISFPFARASFAPSSFIRSYILCVYILWMFMYAHAALYLFCVLTRLLQRKRRQYQISVRRRIQWKRYLGISVNLMFPFMDPMFFTPFTWFSFQCRCACIDKKKYTGTTLSPAWLDGC